jgi:hypothetical protein
VWGTAILSDTYRLLYCREEEEKEEEEQKEEDEEEEEPEDLASANAVPPRCCLTTDATGMHEQLNDENMFTSYLSCYHADCRLRMKKHACAASFGWRKMS